MINIDRLFSFIITIDIINRHNFVLRSNCQKMSNLDPRSIRPDEFIKKEKENEIDKYKSGPCSLLFLLNPF